MKLDLRGKTILVTGGARGIGAALVRALLECGSHVVIHHGSSEPARPTAEAEQFRNIRADLNRPAEVTKLWNETLKWRGQLDVIVNNAGLVEPTTIDDEFDKWFGIWTKTIQINLISVAILCRYAIEHFRPRGGGIIINIASRAAFRGDEPHLMHYAASKGGLVALTRSIARGYARDNILAYLVAPGFVKTERQKKVIGARGEETMVRDIPLGAMADPEDIAPIVAFLATGMARHATGTTIDVNGASYLH